MPLGYPRDDSFQAPDFYQRLGYEVFGVIDRHPWGYQKVFLQKRLAWPLMAEDNGEAMGLGASGAACISSAPA